MKNLAMLLFLVALILSSTSCSRNVSLVNDSAMHDAGCDYPAPIYSGYFTDTEHINNANSEQDQPATEYPGETSQYIESHPGVSYLYLILSRSNGFNLDIADNMFWSQLSTVPSFMWISGGHLASYISFSPVGNKRMIVALYSVTVSDSALSTYECFAALSIEFAEYVAEYGFERIEGVLGNDLIIRSFNPFEFDPGNVVPDDTALVFWDDYVFISLEKATTERGDRWYQVYVRATPIPSFWRDTIRKKQDQPATEYPYETSQYIESHPGVSWLDIILSRSNGFNLDIAEVMFRLRFSTVPSFAWISDYLPDYVAPSPIVSVIRYTVTISDSSLNTYEYFTALSSKFAEYVAEYGFERIEGVLGNDLEKRFFNPFELDPDNVVPDDTVLVFWDDYAFISLEKATERGDSWYQVYVRVTSVPSFWRDTIRGKLGLAP